MACALGIEPQGVPGVPGVGAGAGGVSLTDDDARELSPRSQRLQYTG